MTTHNPKPKFNLGDVVKVKHPTKGDWTGTVRWRSLADDMWEYAVSNSPIVRSEYPEDSDMHFRPLAWECEMTLIRKEKKR